MKTIATLLLFSGMLNAQIKNPRNIYYTWKTDTSIRNIDLSEISTIVQRNTFPRIDYPKFVLKDEGLESFYKYEPVIAVELNGEAKAYPLNMLTMHEISNDVIGGVPVLPTYCPLCNSSIVYSRILNHKEQKKLLTFEVSGMLRKSDMLMADKETETWWQQLTGEAVVGELTGAQLKIIPSLVISVEEFFDSYPKGKILSTNTQTRAQGRYGYNPYVNYDDPDGKPMESFFDINNLDSRLPAMERIVDIKGEKGYKIYPFTKIAEKGVINDTFERKEIVLFYNDKTISVLDNRIISISRNIGSVTLFSRVLGTDTLSFLKSGNRFIDDQSHSEWNITGKCIKGKLKGKQLKKIVHGNHFAFAWLAFYPDSEIYTE